MTNKFLVASILLAMAAGCATDPASDPDLGSTDSALSSNTKAAFEFFVKKGLTKKQSAGIVGNLMQESGVDPTAKQFGGGPGRGIAQWSVGGRWDTSSQDNMTWYANKHSVSRWALNPQLNFIWYELTTVGGYGIKPLRAATTIDAATVAFMRDFEICGDCETSNREAYAHQVYNAYATSASLVDSSTEVDDVAAPAAQVNDPQ